MEGRKTYDFVSTLPHSIIRSSISSFNVKDEILDKLNFVNGIDDVQSAHSHLSEKQEKDGSGIQLQMTPRIVGNNGITSCGIISIAIKEYCTC